MLCVVYGPYGCYLSWDLNFCGLSIHKSTRFYICHNNYTMLWKINPQKFKPLKLNALMVCTHIHTYTYTYTNILRYMLSQ